MSDNRDWASDAEQCWDCNGARTVPDLGDGEDGYEACPSCVVDAGPTFVLWE